MPLMLRPILTARDFISALLLGAVASCLALVTGMFFGFGETRLAVCFAAVTVLIVLYVAVSPAPIAVANLRPLPPSLTHRRLLGHPLIADCAQTIGSVIGSHDVMKEAERHDTLFAMADAFCYGEAPFWCRHRAGLTEIAASLGVPGGYEGAVGSAMTDPDTPD